MAGLPHDKNSKPVQALFPASQVAVTVTGTTARTAADFDVDTLAVELTPTEDMYIKFGDSTVTATSSDVLIKSGIVYVYAINGNDRLAAIRVSTNGTLYVTELQ